MQLHKGTGMYFLAENSYDCMSASHECKEPQKHVRGFFMQLHPHTINHHIALARTRETHEPRLARHSRQLLQSSSSAAPGSTTSTGLLICTPFDLLSTNCVSAKICAVALTRIFLHWLLDLCEQYQSKRKELLELPYIKFLWKTFAPSMNLSSTADTPVNSSALDPDDFTSFFANTYNNNSAKGIYLTPGNYSASHMELQWIQAQEYLIPIAKILTWKCNFPSAVNTLHFSLFTCADFTIERSLQLDRSTQSMTTPSLLGKCTWAALPIQIAPPPSN